MTVIALVMYSVGMIAFGLREILGKVFYSLQDTKTPMMNGAIAVIMNIILNLVLVRYFKLAGLALATSISAIICILLLFNSLKKKIGYFGQDKILNTIIKSIISASVMGVITYLSYNSLSTVLNNGFIYDMLSLFGSIIIGFIIYIILVTLLKVEELNIIKDIIKRKTYKS